MKDKILLGYVIIDILFVISGGLIIIFAFTTKNNISQTLTAENVATDLLLAMCPLNGAIANAVFVFFTFLVSIPAIVMPTNRGWLKLSGYMTAISALFTMILGLTIWFDTLKTRTNLLDIWNVQTPATQSLIQKHFSCCGYFDSTSPPFAVDATCPNPQVAAARIGCVGGFSTYANNFLDLIFTGAFGIVGVDVALIMATAMLLKDRKEKERYRHIDEKSGVGSF